MKYDVLWLGISPAPEKLQKNIHVRLLARIKDGMVTEAQRLHKAGLSYKRMEELGLEYRYLALLLQKKISKEEFIEQLERAINKYAKRQKTYFKRNKDIVWVSSKTEALRLAKQFLKK
jgi:tRNA dimethylallyltransferase